MKPGLLALAVGGFTSPLWVGASMAFAALGVLVLAERVAPVPQVPAQAQALAV